MEGWIRLAVAGGTVTSGPASEQRRQSQSSSGRYDGCFPSQLQSGFRQQVEERDTEESAAAEVHQRVASRGPSFRRKGAEHAAQESGRYGNAGAEPEAGSLCKTLVHHLILKTLCDTYAVYTRMERISWCAAGNSSQPRGRNPGIPRISCRRAGWIPITRVDAGAALPPLRKGPFEVMSGKRLKTESRLAQLTPFQWLEHVLARSRAIAGVLAFCLLFASSAGVLSHHCAGDAPPEVRGGAVLLATDLHPVETPVSHLDCVARAWLACDRSQPGEHWVRTEPAILCRPAGLPPIPTLSPGTPRLPSSRGPPAA